ncbi:MAG: DegT/DnrJ/EryC1/StrS family aminotransferase [candidate division WOR-3 bacterium]
MIPLLDLKRQYASLDKEINEALVRVAASGNYVLGPEVKAFEEEFARYVGVKHAVGVGNGTDALRMALKALDVGPGDEVITVPFTFVATAEAIAELGARPVFVDINPKTFNMEPDLVEKAITPRTKGILPVHLYGQVADTDTLGRICEDHGLFMLEDAAQAAGSARNGRKAGSIGTSAIFSFYPTKNLSAIGDGGMITTNDSEMAERLRYLRVHGSARKYEHSELGYNSRLDEIQAAVLRVRLPHLDTWNARRREIASIYNAELAGLVETPFVEPGCEHTYHQYTIIADRRDELSAFLKERGIGSAIHYPLPLHLQPAFAYLGYKPGDFPVSESMAKRVISLPVFPELSDQEVLEVARAIKEFYSR